MKQVVLAAILLFGMSGAALAACRPDVYGNPDTSYTCDDGRKIKPEVYGSPDTSYRDNNGNVYRPNVYGNPDGGYTGSDGSRLTPQTYGAGGMQGGAQMQDNEDDNGQDND